MSTPEQYSAVAHLAGVEARSVRHFLFAAVDRSMPASTTQVSVISPLWTFNVPVGHCVLAARIDVDSYPVSATGANLYAQRQRGLFSENVSGYFTVNESQTTPARIAHRCFEGDVFLPFPSGAKVSYSVVFVGGSDAMKASYRVSGFLLPQKAFDRLAALQSFILS